MAVEKGNSEIVKLLLTNDKIHVNSGNIFFFLFFIQFKKNIYIFNWIQKYIFKLHSKEYYSMEFLIISLNYIQIILYNEILI